jgi:hypothetical protein
VKRTLRFLGILLMGITAAVTMLGGVGTTCVALNAPNYESMKGIADYQWLYILFVLIGIGLGISGIRATTMLARCKKGAETSSLITLLAGLAIGIIHITSSRALRGSSMPVDGVVYITGLTLVLFLLYRLPGLRKMALFQHASSRDAAAGGGLTSIVSAGMILSVGVWAGPSHQFNGLNYANAFQAAMTWTGLGLLLFGLGLIARVVLSREGTRAIEWLS